MLYQIIKLDGLWMLIVNTYLFILSVSCYIREGKPCDAMVASVSLLWTKIKKKINKIRINKDGIGFLFVILPYRKAVRTEAVAANERIYYYDKEVFILTLTLRRCRNGKRRRAIA